MKQLVRNRHDAEGGFILISLSILLIVIGLLVSAYLYMANIRQAQEQKKKTNTSIQSTMNKMADYMADKGKYPCPAANNLSPGNANYGLETACTDTSVASGSCGNGYCVTTGSGGKRVRIGIIPFATLKIDPEDAVDAFGNFLTYAVTEKQAITPNPATGAGYVENGGAISYDEPEIDENGNYTGVILPTKTNVNFALISHGKDGRGSTMPNGNPNAIRCIMPTDPPPLPPIPLDNENCDNDATFYMRPYSEAEGVDYFDDQVETVLLDWVYIWDSTYGDYQDSYSRGPLESYVGVGNDDPQEKLHVGKDGVGNLKIQSGALSTKRLCDRNGNNCFNPNVLGGDPNAAIPAGESAKAGMDCGADSLMTDIRNGKPVCSTFPTASTGGCSEDANGDGENDSFFIGLQFDGNTLTAVCKSHLSGNAQNVPLQ